ncbi:MAG: hypothetical protein Q4G21_11345 [Dermabacter sp.]|nr:hypothetical protein [Dermabacter sp.]
MGFLDRFRATPATRIAKFWTWWSDHQAELAAAYADDGDESMMRMVPKVSRAVSAIDRDLEWEVSKGATEGSYHFVVTATGDDELYQLAKEWYEAAPTNAGPWTFAPVRSFTPATEEDVITVNGTTVDLAELRFDISTSLTQVDVNVSHPAFEGIDDEKAGTLAVFLLDNILSEEIVEWWIGGITPVPHPAGEATVSDLRYEVESFRAQYLTEDGSLTWTIAQAEIEGMPALVRVQVPLCSATAPGLNQHVLFELCYGDDGPEGLPGSLDMDRFGAVEDQLEAAMGDNGRIVAIETGRHLRTVHMYVNSSSGAVGRLGPLAAQAGARFEHSPDPAWKNVDHVK